MLLFSNSSHFPINTTIFDLVNHLFVEAWSTKVDLLRIFSSMFTHYNVQYTYIVPLNSLYTVTLILGLYGGLSFVLKWICPKMIYVLHKLYYWRKKRSNAVRPENDIEVATIEPINTVPISTNLPNGAVSSVSISTSPKYITCLFIVDAIYQLSSSILTRFILLRFFLFGFLIIIVMTMAFIGPLVYRKRQRHYPTTQTSMILLTSFLIYQRIKLR